MATNITMDSKKLFFTMVHSNLGSIADNSNLINITSEPISDTFEVRDPGVGGGRVKINKADTGRKLTIEVQTGSTLELMLRRAIRYKNTEFTCLWADERVSTNIQGGSASECSVNPNIANDRGAETVSFEIYSMNYSGD
jgi:hypothetical protein